MKANGKMGVYLSPPSEIARARHQYIVEQNRLACRRETKLSQISDRVLFDLKSPFSDKLRIANTWNFLPPV